VSLRSAAVVWSRCVDRIHQHWCRLEGIVVAFALTGCLSYVLLSTRSEGLFDVLGRAFRRYVWRGR
jgi:hypothetical protein